MTTTTACATPLTDRVTKSRGAVPLGIYGGGMIVAACSVPTRERASRLAMNASAGAGWGIVTFTAGVLLVSAWLSAVSVRLYRAIA